MASPSFTLSSEALWEGQGYQRCWERGGQPHGAVSIGADNEAALYTLKPRQSQEAPGKRPQRLWDANQMVLTSSGGAGEASRRKGSLRGDLQGRLTAVGSGGYAYEERAWAGMTTESWKASGGWPSKPLQCSVMQGPTTSVQSSELIPQNNRKSLFKGS